VDAKCAIDFESPIFDYFSVGTRGGFFGKAGQQRFKMLITIRNVEMGEQLLDVPLRRN
jgi:hypothetical protein